MEADLPRSARATRGKRLTKLVDDEVEADNTFWGQEAFKEENNDKEYEEEEEQVDEFDSDFDEDEPESDNEEQKEEKEVVKKKKKFPYRKPVADKKKKSVSFLLRSAARADKSKSKKKPAPQQNEQEEGEPGEGERTTTIRKSSRMSVVAKQQERAAKLASQTTPKPVKKKKEEEKKMSQEEMLLEAAQTEVINKQSLERMLAREEEVKKKAIIQKIMYTGPQIRFVSKDGRNVLEFTKVSTFPSTINSRAKPYPERAVCVITGLPARYKDPKTGLPYATKEAFKQLRERFLRGDKSTRKDSLEEIHQRKRTRVETERASSRAGVMKLKFKRSPSSKELSPLPAQQAKVVTPPPPLLPPPPVQIEEVDEADFMLDTLADVRRNFGVEENIMYETNEALEASFATGEFWKPPPQQQQQQPEPQ